LEISIPFVADEVLHSFNYYTLRVKGREKLIEKLNKAKIGNMVYYPLPLHLQEVYKDLGYKNGDFPVSEMVAEEVLSLPMFPELKKDQIKEIVEVINSNK